MFKKFVATSAIALLVLAASACTTQSPAPVPQPTVSVEAVHPSPQAPIEEEAIIPIDLGITTMNDKDFADEAWDALDHLTDAELAEYDLATLRVAPVGTAEAGFATETLFTVETPDTVYVFSKTKAHSQTIALSSLTAQERATLTTNFPTCDVDNVQGCISGDGESVVFGN